VVRLCWRGAFVLAWLACVKRLRKCLTVNDLRKSGAARPKSLTVNDLGR
jgi:hypothetical protein